MTEERKAFKDYFDRTAAKALAKQIEQVHASFDSAKFVRSATKKLAELEMMDRVKQFSQSLRTHLPDEIPKALYILTQSLPAPLPDCEEVTNGYIQWPIGQFIADYGINHFDASFEAMIELTQRFSSEFAVRPFLERDQDDTIRRLLALTDHPNPHVRRWCSEGVRPRLPWGRKIRSLVDDPNPIFPIVEALKDDPEIYVRRSVANNLNDIAKDHPKLAVKRCKQWSKNATPERAWIVKHALRTLIKDGDKDALALIGFRPPKDIKAKLEAEPKFVEIGESVTLAALIQNSAKRPQNILLDYVVRYVRKGGKTSDKVFKWKTLEIAPNSKVTLTKNHSMKKTTIRALYDGVHEVELQVNGERVARTSFELLQ